MTNGSSMNMIRHYIVAPFIVSLVLLIVGLFLFKNTGVNNLEIIKKNDFPLNTLYSHRGLNSINNVIGNLEGENSIPSFELAGKNGYKYLETDIHETKDGKFFCIHDNTTISYSRFDFVVTNSLSQDILNVKLNKIIKNDRVSKEFQEKVYNIPLLEDYLAICKKYNMVPLIEIKQLQNNTVSVDNLIKAVKKYTDKFIIFSFNLSYVLRAKRYDGNIPVLYLTPEDNEITKDVVDLYASFGIGIAPPLNKVSKDVCEYSFNKGYPMVIWSVDDKNQYLNEYIYWKVWMFGTNSIVL